METQLHDRLSNDLTQLLKSGVNYDISIEVGEDGANIYKVHSIILQSRSPYFKNKFDEISFNENHVKVLKLPNISVKVFDVIIKYIYSGKVLLEKLENSFIFDLLVASNELELDELVEHLQSNFVNSNASWSSLNFAQIYRTSYQDKNLKIIRVCNNIITKYPNAIFESKNFYFLPEDALVSILKQDDLQLEESRIWEYVIEWGKAKNPTLPNSLDKWTSDNFSSLKKTLNLCLQHIRYFNIPGEDVVKKIYPYQQLLENQLFLDIASKIMAPNVPISSLVLPLRKLTVTDIITNEHALEISSWIDKQEKTYTENNPYEFKLLVKGSRDGFDVETIYNICDAVSNTVIVLKVEDTGEILGGFNPLEWNKDNNLWKNTDDSFVFSLKIANLKKSILSRAFKDNTWAIDNCPRDSSLSFGKALCLKGNLKTEKKGFCAVCGGYSKRIRSDEFITPVNFLSGVSPEFLFSVEEYVVFKILPKVR